jgi:hypothetical protein
VERVPSAFALCASTCASPACRLPGSTKFEPASLAVHLPNLTPPSWRGSP